MTKGTTIPLAVDRRLRNHIGASVIAHLTEPLYSVDHEVVPKGAIATGTIRGEHRGSRRERILRLLAGDFTPPRTPELTFETLAFPDGHQGMMSVKIEAPAEQTDASVLTVGVKTKKQTVKSQARAAIQSGKAAIRTGRDETVQTLKHPLLAERIEKWAVHQLPYHPEFIWSGTRFNACLVKEVHIGRDAYPALPIQPLEGKLPEGVLHARMTEELSSDTAKRGDPVDAIITQPLLSPDRTHVLVPQGSILHGVVMHTKAARSFGRNGSLRFTFRSIDLKTPLGQSQPTAIHGRLSAAETAPGQHVSMDEEGEVKASDGPAKVAEPLLLGVFAVAATPDDHDQAGGGVGAGTTTVASNGFGLIARVVSLASRNTGVLQGFAYYSLGKSIYFHYIARGHETTFQRDTELQVTLSER